jgi:hypothetical protein
MFYDIYLYTLCYYICCLLGACMRCTRFCPFKTGCYKCYHIDQEDHDGENHLGMPGSDGALAPVSRVEIPRELAVVQVPAGGQDTQLEQLREMQAKLDEEAGRLVQL